MPVTIRALSHIVLPVADLDAALAFYRDLLGMELIGRRPSVTADYVAQQTGYDNVELNVASFRISPTCRQTMEVVQYMNHTGQQAATETNRAGNSHLCLLVDDLKTAVRDLSTAGVVFQSDPVEITAGPNQGGLVIYLKDPDGYTLELFQPPNNPPPRNPS